MPRSGRIPAGRRFSADRQPERRRSRRTPGKPAGWDRREVLRLAAKGIEAPDLARILGLVGRLQAEPELRGEFEEAVAEGHARYRGEIAARVYDRGLVKGAPSVLLAAARGWLPRYDERSLPPDVESGIADRLVSLIVSVQSRPCTST